MTEYTVRIFPIGVDREDVLWLRQALERIFNASVLLEEKTLTLGLLVEAFNEERGQIHAEKLLTMLQSTTGVLPHQRILALIDGDGYVDGLNFVFGIAKPGWGGLIFTKRLRPEFYGETPSVTLYRMRLLKESLHELGHSFGLPHCTQKCVMRFSNSVYDIDDKPASYCTTCRVNLNRLAPGLLR